MIVFLNGHFVAEERAVVSVFDRGYLYGDGLFEVVRICNARPFRWKQHIERFLHGAKHLEIHPPFSTREIEVFAARLLAKNKMNDALLRLSLSRGVGQRGYSPKGADKPTLVMTMHPIGTPSGKSAAGQRPASKLAPPCWNLVTASNRLPVNEPLALFKSANKLPQILSRAEADSAGANEALLLNTRGHVVEGTTSNLFWVRRGVICTPPLAAGVLPGVTRMVVLEICRNLNWPTREVSPRPRDLFSAEGVFLSMSSWGIVEAIELDGRQLRRSGCIRKLQQVYAGLLDMETK